MMNEEKRKKGVARNIYMKIANTTVNTELIVFTAIKAKADDLSDIEVADALNLTDKELTEAFADNFDFVDHDVKLITKEQFLEEVGVDLEA